MKAPPPSFYVTGGTLRYDAPSYVEREADRELLEGLQQREFCYVLTSRQMGKSSLMVRTANRLRAQGLRVVVLDLTAIGQNLTPEQWYDGLAMQMARQLQLEDEVETYWTGHAHLGPCQRFFAAIRDKILPVLQGRAPVSPALPRAETAPFPRESSTAPSTSDSLVIFVDEIDVVRNLPFSTDEFFAATRECYNRRAEDPELNRVTFCLLGVATPSDLIRDTRLTPFNIGQRIELNDFTTEEAVPLAEGLENPNFKIENRKVLLERILYWTGGHPYLTQRLCREVAEAGWHGNSQSSSLVSGRFIDKLCEGLFFSSQARERDDNLIFVRERLLRAEIDLVSLLEEYLKVRSGTKVIDDETSALVSVLKLSGIVKSEDGHLRERNRIYSSVFDREWVKAHIPDVELRRQRAAFRRGVIRTTAIATVVVAALTIMVVIAGKQYAKARGALAQTYFSQARTERMSGRAGQHVISLSALEKARPFYPNKLELRNATIASFALLDLQTNHLPIAVPPDASTLALNNGLTHCAAGDASGAIRLIEMARGRVAAEFPAIGIPISWLAISPNGRFVAAQYDGPDDDWLSEHRLVVWDSDSQQRALSFTNEVLQTALDFSGDGSRLAVGLPEGRIEVVALPNERIASLASPMEIGEPRVPYCVRLDASGQQLAESSQSSQYVQIWNLNGQSGTTDFRLATSLPHSGLIVAIAWSADGQHLATAMENQTLSVWDLRLPQKKREFLLTHSEPVIDLVFSPNGDLLASLGADRTLKLWRVATGRPVTHEVESEPSGRLHFSHDGQRLGYAGAKPGIQIWDVLGLDKYRVFCALGNVNTPFTSVSFGPEGRVIVGANALGIFTWDSATGRELGFLSLRPTTSALLHPLTGDLLASTPHGFYRWPRQTTQDGNSLALQYERPHCLPLPAALGRCALEPSGTRAAVVHKDHIHLFDLEGSSNRSIPPCKGPFGALAISPGGKWLVTCSEARNAVEVWRLLDKLQAEPNPVKVIPGSRHFAFSPDGRFLMTCWERQYHLWDTRSWQNHPMAFSALGCGDAHSAIAFAPIGRTGEALLALANRPTTIKLFKLGNGLPVSLLELAELESPDPRPLLALTFNADGSRLAATTAEAVQVWNLAGISEELTRMKLGSGLPDFIARPEGPLTVVLATDPPDTEIPRKWQEVELLSGTLEGAPHPESGTVLRDLLRRGRLYLDLGQPLEAKRDFENALRISPDDADIHKLLRNANSALKQQAPAAGEKQHRAVGSEPLGCHPPSRDEGNGSAVHHADSVLRTRPTNV